MKKLADIGTFGGVDAESDRSLNAVFEEHPSYRAVLGQEHQIVLGRKGSGKSAIFRKICDSRDHVADGYSMSDYPWEYHALQKQTVASDEESYRESWKFFIATMFAKLAIANKDKLSPFAINSSRFSDIEKFVVDSYGPDLMPSNVFAPGKKLKLRGSLNVLGVGAEVQQVEVNHLPKHYGELNRLMFDALTAILPTDTKFFLCFDELDIGFDPTNREYLTRLIGLIRAAKYANDRFNSEGKPASVIIVLRDDIWNILKFEDKNKLTQNRLTEIKWEIEGGSASLKSLMERRFSLALGRQVSWDDVFETQMMAQLKPKLSYICDRGFLRPRDVIQFCNFVLRHYRAKDPAHQTERFTNEDVKGADSGYSKHFLGELEDELLKHSPEYERYFGVLKEMLNVTFSKDEFTEEWQRQKGLFTPDSTVEAALASLFDFSVIGFLSTGGERRGSGYTWKYLNPNARFDPDAKKYQVHLGLRDVFELKLRAKSKR